MSNQDHLMSEEDVQEQMPNWVPDNRPGPTTATVPPALRPNAMPDFFQGSLPPTQQHDTTFVGTEVASARIPKTALMPLPQQSNAFTNAGVQSTALKTASSLPPNVSISLLMPKEFEVTGSPAGPTGEFDVAWAPETPGFYLGVPQFGGSGFLDTVTLAGSVNTTVVSSSLTPATNNEMLLWFLTTSFLSGITQPVPDGAGWVALDPSSTGGAFLYARNITGPYTGTETLSGNTTWASAMVACGSNGNAPALAQAALGFGGGSIGGNTFTAAFSVPMTATNAIFIFINSQEANGPATTTSTATDTDGNIYTQIASVARGSAGSPNPVQIIILAAFNIVHTGLTNTVTVNVASGTLLAGGVIGYEVTGLAAIPTTPSFIPVVVTGAPTITGSPATGNLTKFSGPGSITNTDLTGDVTTAGSSATTLANTAVTPGAYTSANITVDSKGRITAAANGSGGGGGATFQTMQRRTSYVANGSTATLGIIGDILQQTDVGTPAAALPTATIGPVVVFPPAAGPQQIFLSSLLSGGGINFSGGNSGNYVTGRNVKIQWKGYFSTTGDGDLWLAMFTGSSSGNDAVGIGRQADPAVSSQVSGAGFRCFNRLGHSLETTWQAYVGNGVTPASTIVNTGVTQDTAEHTFAIIFNDTVPNVTFYIDGTLVATITTTLPASAAPMAMVIGARYDTTTLNYGFDSAVIDCDI